MPFTPHVAEAVADGAEWDRTPLLPLQIQERMVAFLEAHAGQDAQLRYPASALLGYVSPRRIAMADWCATRSDEALRRNGVMYRAHAQWLAGGARGPAQVAHVRDAQYDGMNARRLP